MPKILVEGKLVNVERDQTVGEVKLLDRFFQPSAADMDQMQQVDKILSEQYQRLEVFLEEFLFDYKDQRPEERRIQYLIKITEKQLKLLESIHLIFDEATHEVNTIKSLEGSALAEEDATPYEPRDRPRVAAEDAHLELCDYLSGLKEQQRLFHEAGLDENQFVKDKFNNIYETLITELESNSFFRIQKPSVENQEDVFSEDETAQDREDEATSMSKGPS